MYLLFWLIFADFCEIFRHFRDLRRFQRFRGINLALKIVRNIAWSTASTR